MKNSSGDIHVLPLFITLLQVMFIGLKLAGFIDWPWPVVFAPFIVDVGVLLVLLALLGLCYFIENRS